MLLGVVDGGVGGLLRGLRGGGLRLRGTREVGSLVLARFACSCSDDAVFAATDASSMTPAHVVESWSSAPSW